MIWEPKDPEVMIAPPMPRWCLGLSENSGFPRYLNLNLNLHF